MTQLHDQFSAVRKAQFEAQFDFFNSFTTQAIENASRLAALNLAVSRDAVQRSLGAGFALMNSRDPRDVLTLGGQAEEGMRSLFAYGRELIGIAGAVRPFAVRALVQAPQQAVETVEHAPVAVIDAAAAPAATAEPVVAAEPEAAPEPLAALAEPVPVAETTAIAKAVGKGNARAAAIAHPAAAPVAVADEVEVPKLDLPKADLPKIEIAPVSHNGGGKRRK